MTRQWRIGRVCVLRHAGMPFDWIEELGAARALVCAADAVIDAEEGLAGAPDAIHNALRAGEPRRLPASLDRKWQGPLAVWEKTLVTYQAMYVHADEDASGLLADVMGRGRAAEAVFLSNPGVYRNMLLPFLSCPGPVNARTRRARRQLYTYLQRFCAKNETVSFFGPMAYGEALPGSEAVIQDARPVTSRVFLASWAARELAAAIAADRQLRTQLPFRSTGERTLPGATITEIAQAAGSGRRETAKWLNELVRAGEAEFGVAPGPYDLDPLARMAEQLAKLPTSAAREAWVKRLNVLRDLLHRMEHTPFPDRIDLVATIEAVFTEATGTPARRGHGAIYADRAIFYEECSSPFALTLGEDLLRTWEHRLAPAMELCTEHGWAAWTAAQRVVAEKLPGGQAMNLADYSTELRAIFDLDGSTFTAAHIPVYSASDVTRLISTGPSRQGDRYAVIDVCPIAGTIKGVADAVLLLSRCHHQLLTDGWLATMHPDPTAFAADATAWLATQPQLVGLDVGRRNKGYYLFPGRRILLRPRSHADADRPGTFQPVSVTIRPGQARICCFDDAGEEISLYLPLTDYAKYPPYAALSAPQVLHAAFGSGDTGAVLAEGVVYQRPRWLIKPTEVSMARPDARFLALRRIARRAGVRFLFCRSETERKPYLIDLESVLAADLIGHIATGPLIAEQMLPGPQQLWLRDAQGHRYTCELRMQIIGREAT
jgi:hypothetical protein